VAGDRLGRSLAGISVPESRPRARGTNRISSREIRPTAPKDPWHFSAGKSLRDEWAKNEKPALCLHEIFETFNALYGRIDREANASSLFWDGILSWSRPEAASTTPYFFSAFNCSSTLRYPNSRLSEADHPSELYSALFQSMIDVDGRAIGRCREEWSGKDFIRCSMDGF